MTKMLDFHRYPTTKRPSDVQALLPRYGDERQTRPRIPRAALSRALTGVAQRCGYRQPGRAENRNVGLKHPRTVPRGAAARKALCGCEMESTPYTPGPPYTSVAPAFAPCRAKARAVEPRE